ncbi:MAG TPA: hypothetical protein VMC85_01670, partial [Desulfomonilaceae bacterium]|nr:hypothetical protein [Desulfomonilaceae bacterium]
LSGDLSKAFGFIWIAKYKRDRNDMHAAELSLKEAIAILERHAPESSLLIGTLRDYADLLLKAKRSSEARTVQEKADKIAAQKVITPMP